MVILKRSTGSLEPKPQGNGGGHGKLAGVVDWIGRRIKERRDLTLDELLVEPRDGPGVEAQRVSVWRRLRRLDLTHKKDLCAIEQKRLNVALARDVLINRRQPFMRNMLTRISFIDETSVKAKMAGTTGWSQCRARLLDHALFGHWQTQTFIATLRHDRLDAPWVIGGAMNREFFDLCIETQLAPTLHKGDVVILDNLATHRSPKAAAILKDIGQGAFGGAFGQNFDRVCHGLATGERRRRAKAWDGRGLGLGGKPRFGRGTDGLECIRGPQP